MNKIFILVITSISLYSCTKEINQNKDSMQETFKNYELDVSKIPVKQGILIFEDGTHFKLVVTANNGKKNGSDNNQSNYSAQRGLTEIFEFKSMADAFDEISEHELKIADSLETLEIANPGSITTAIFDGTHSYLKPRYENSYHEKTFDDGTKYLEINTKDYTIAEFINEDGFVQIGDTLHQISYDLMKKMYGGPEDQQTLATATDSDPSSGIFITNETQNTMARVSGLPEHSAIRKSCQNTNKRARILGYYNMITYRFASNPLTFEPEQNVTAKALKRRVFGLWWDYAGSDADLGVNWNIRGNSSSGSFIRNGVFTGGNVSWGTAGNGGTSFNYLFERFLSYNRNTQGRFITRDLPIIFQATTVNSANVYTTRSKPLGFVSCSCSYTR